MARTSRTTRSFRRQNQNLPTHVDRIGFPWLHFVVRTDFVHPQAATLALPSGWRYAEVPAAGRPASAAGAVPRARRSAAARGAGDPSAPGPAPSRRPAPRIERRSPTLGEEERGSPTKTAGISVLQIPAYEKYVVSFWFPYLQRHRFLFRASACKALAKDQHSTRPSPLNLAPTTSALTTIPFP